MVEKVSAQQAYVDYVMKNLPDAKRGNVHVMQKGDNLWNLAKRALNKKDASNKEISDYMLLIAKLNNLNTIEEMNSLKISDKIYMPEVSASKSIHSGAKIKENPSVPNSAEKSILDLKETILNDKTVFVEQAYPRFINLYHVYNNYTDPKTGYHSRMHPLLSFQLDKSGNVKNISYDDEKQLNPIKYDYDIDKNGNILISNYTRQIQAGKLDKKELSEIHNILKNLTQNARLSF